MNEMTYQVDGDYLIPNVKLSETRKVSMGKYALMRREYLKKHRPIVWNRMVLEEALYPHLLEIDKTAHHRLEKMMPVLMKLNGVTEELKASDPMQWVGLMNNLKAQAEEKILNELVYC